MAASILLFRLHHHPMVHHWTMASLLKTKATLSRSSTTQTTQLLFPVVMETTAVKSAKPLTSVRKT